ncbi:MAG TPA: DUF5018 domain-containing protein [Flavisolibacter sp.]|jgi:hypothetical protein|nr:DUF5018 domain-containing protein [Flavisolibacter sp.]
MNKLFSQLSALLCVLVVFNACVKPDLIERNAQADFADIWVEIPSVKERFNATFNAQKDTAYIDMSYFYPAESDFEVDLKNLILRASIPVDAKVAPALGTPSDLTNPVTLTVNSGTGETRNIVVVVRKLSDLSIKSADITYVEGGTSQNVEAIPSGDELVFYVLPGIDLSNATLNVEVSRHSQTSVASGATINLNNPVPITVTGVDGRTKTYTLVAREPQRLAYGFGINRKMWSKTAAELGFAANMDVSVAVSGENLITVSRTNPSKYRIYNRFTGDFIRDLSLPFAGLSFQVAEDSAGRFIGCSWAPKNSTFLVYKWDNVNATPVKLIEWVNNNPTGITLDGGVGRRVNIFGDLNDDAVIMATAGQSSIIYKWIIENGVLRSNTPVVMDYKNVAGGSNTKMGFYPEAQPISADPNTDFFVNYQFELALVDGTTYTKKAAFADETNIYGLFHMPTALATFNNAKYIAIVKYVETFNLNRVQMSLFDITDISKISTPSNSPAYPSFNVFNSELLIGATNPNGTADITIAFSPDKERMQVYMLLTNGGILAQEFTKYEP